MKLPQWLKKLPGRGSTGRQAGLVVFGDGLTFLALFATSMILARIIVPSEMATFRQVTYLGPLVVTLFELGLSGTVYRFYNAYQGSDRRAFVRQALAAIVALGATGSMLLLLLSWPLSRAYGNDALAPALLVVGAYPLVCLPFMLVRPVLISKGHSLRATLWESAFASLAALAIILPLYGGWSLNQAFTLWILVNAGKLPVALVYLRAEVDTFRSPWNARIAAEVWSYIWPIQLSRVAGIAMVYFDKVLTSVFFSKERFAAYSLGAREIPFLNGIAYSVSSVMIPRMVDRHRDNGIEPVCSLWRKACVSTATLTYPFAAFAVWHAQVIMQAMFTEVYEESSIPFRAYAALTFLRVVDYGSIAKALGDSRVILRGAVLTGAIGLGAATFLIWKWGIWGISFSLLLSTTTFVLYYLATYRYTLRVPLRAFFPWPQLLFLAALGFGSVSLGDQLLSALVCMSERRGLLELAAGLGVLLAGSGLLYAGFVLALRRFAPSLFNEVALPRLRRSDATALARDD